MKRRKKMRMIAGFTAFTLLLTGNGMPAFSFQTPEPVATSGKPGLAPDQLEALAIPERLGFVQRVFQGQEGNPVLVLQDAHANAAAQKAVRDLILHFSAEYGMKSVVLEGGIGNLDATLFRSFPDADMRSKVFEEYLDRGELSGAIPAAVSDDRIIFKGAETATLYEQELLSFLKAQIKQTEAEASLRRELEALQKRKLQLYSPRMRELDQSLLSLEKDPSRLAETFEQLCRFRNPAGYEHLNLLREALAGLRQAELPETRSLLESEARKMEALLKDAGAARDYHAIRQRFDTGQASGLEFAAFLSTWIHEHAPESDFPEVLEGLAEHHRFLHRLNGAVFVEEFERFSREVQESLLESPQARELFEQDRRLRLLEKLAGLKLTRGEWDELRMKEISLPPVLSEAERFYQIAVRRDLLLFEALQDSLKASTSNQNTPVLLVAGGFHTQGVTAMLEKNGISFAVLAPTTDVEAPDIYTSLMQGGVSWKPWIHFENEKASLYKSFTAAVTERLFSAYEEKEKRPAGVLRMAWRNRLLQRLAAQGRLDKAAEYTPFLDLAGRKGAADPFQRKAWRERLENFSEELTRLIQKRELNDLSLARLFGAPAAPPITDKPLFRDLYLTRELAQWMPEFAGRAELRTLERTPPSPREVKALAAGASPPPPRDELRVAEEGHEAVFWMAEQLYHAADLAARSDLPQIVLDQESRLAALEKDKDRDTQKRAEYENLQFQLETFYRPLLGENLDLEVFLGNLLKALRKVPGLRLELANTPFFLTEAISLAGLETPPGIESWKRFSFRAIAPLQAGELMSRITAHYEAIPYADGFLRLVPEEGSDESSEKVDFQLEGDRAWRLLPGARRLQDTGLQQVLEQIFQKDLAGENLYAPQEIRGLLSVEVRRNAKAAAQYETTGTNGAQSSRLVIDRTSLEDAAKNETARRVLVREVEAVLDQILMRPLLAHPDIGLPVLFTELSNVYQAQAGALLKTASLRNRLRRFLNDFDRSAQLEWLRQPRFGASSKLRTLLESADARLQSGESPESILEALTLAVEPEEGSLAAYLMESYPEGAMADGFSSLGDKSLLLWRLSRLDRSYETLHLDYGAEAFRRYGTNASPNGTYWQAASTGLQRRLVQDLGRRIAEQRKEKIRRELFEKRKLSVSEAEAEPELRRQLDFELEPHQLLYKDFQETSVYKESPHRISGLLDHYRQRLEASASVETAEGAADEENQDESRLMAFLLSELKFPEKERIRIWPGNAADARKIEKLTGLLDFLTRYEWKESNFVFQPLEAPRTVTELLGHEDGYFRSRWIETHLNNQYFSRLGVFKELGFTTGVFSGKRDEFYSLMEPASVILALIRYPEFRQLMHVPDFDPQTWGQPGRLEETVALARRLLEDVRVQPERPADPAEGDIEDSEGHLTFRDRFGLILGRDLTRRVYSNLFLRQIRQIDYWKPLLRRGLAAAEESQLAEALETDVRMLEADEKHFTDAEGRRVLTVMINARTRITGILVSRYDEAGQLLYVDGRELLKKNVPFEEGRTLADWQALEGDLYSPQLIERQFYEDGLPAMRVGAGPRSSRDASRVVKSVHTYVVEDGQLVSIRSHPLYQTRRAFEDTWTLGDWRRHALDAGEIPSDPEEPEEGVTEVFGYDLITRSNYEIEFSDAETETVSAGRNAREVVTQGIIQKVRFFTTNADDTLGWEDSFKTLAEDIYDREALNGMDAKQQRAYWDGRRGELYGGLERRTYYRFSGRKGEGQEVLTVLADPETGLVQRVETFHYQGKKLLLRDTWLAISPFDFQPFFTLEDWQERLPRLIYRSQRTFYDNKGAVRVELNLDPDGTVQIAGRTQRLEKTDRFYYYEAELVPEIAAFDEARDLAEWEALLDPVDPVFAPSGDDAELQAQLDLLREKIRDFPAVQELLRRHAPRYLERLNFDRIEERWAPVKVLFEKRREVLARAGELFRQYLADRRIRGREDAQEIRLFTESVVDPVLDALTGGQAMDLDLDILLGRTVSLAIQREPRTILGLEAGELAEADSLFPVFSAGITDGDVTQEDAELAARAILGKPAQPKRPELRTLQDKVRQTMSLHEKMEPSRAALTRALALMEASVRRYQKVESRPSRQELENRFLQAAHGNLNTALQSALWIAEYLNETNGTYQKALDDSPLSLLHAAYQMKPNLRRPVSLTDLATDPVLASLVRQGDDEHWNSDIREEALDMMASRTENSRQYDLITSLFSLNGSEGEAGREEVVRRIRAAARLLQTGGKMVITLSARRGFDEEALAQIRAFGFEVEDGVGFNRLTDLYRNELFQADAAQEDHDAVYVENEIRRRQFYVLVLKKTQDLPEEAIGALPTHRIQITRTLEEPPEGEALEGSDDVSLQGSSERQKKLERVEGRHLEPSELQPKGTLARDTPYTRRMADQDLFRFHRRQLEILNKYRGLLLGPDSPVTAVNELQGIFHVLNMGYQDTADSRTRFKPTRTQKNVASPGDFWKEPRDVWISDDATRSVTLRDVEGKPRMALLYKNAAGGRARLTGIAVHETGPSGEILYTENRKLLRTDYEFDPAALAGREADPEVLQQWQALETRVGETVPEDVQPLYSNQLDYGPRRKQYESIDQIFQLLVKIYPVFALYPAQARTPGLDFEQLFRDDTARSMREFREVQFPSGDYVFPYQEQRDFLEAIFKKWEDGVEKISDEEIEKYLELRKWIRGMRSIFQVLGPTFYRQKKRRSSTVGGGEADEEQARRHRRNLGGNTSYLSAHAVAPIVKRILEARQGKAKHLDQAAGTGAMAEALAQQKVPMPEGKDYLLVEMDTDPNMLAVPRAPGFGAEDGVRQLTGDITRLTQEFARLGFKDGPFDIVTALFIIDMLEPEDRKRLFIEANLNMKEGGEYLLTVPQSWEMENPEAFRNALFALGFDVDTPLRGQHLAKQEFLDRVIQTVTEETGQESYAREIAREVGSRLAKQFTILRLRKRVTIDPSSAAVRNLPASAFELTKTETGVRGASTGPRPFQHDPDAMRRWIEILRWLLHEWKAEDIEVFNADDSNLVTREQILGPEGLFPEIETENALNHLYRYRFLFNTQAEAGNHYELITVNHQFWNLGSRHFHRDQILLLRELYLRGPPRQNEPAPFSLKWARGQLEARSRQLSKLAAARPVAGRHLKAVAASAGELAKGIRSAVEGARAAHPLSFLAIPENFYEGRSAPVDELLLNRLRALGPDENGLNVRELAALERFLEGRKKGDDFAVELLVNPESLELPERKETSAAGAKAEQPPEPPVPETGDPEGALGPLTPELLSAPVIQRDLYAIRTNHYGMSIPEIGAAEDKARDLLLKHHPLLAGAPAGSETPLGKALMLATVRESYLTNLSAATSALTNAAVVLNYAGTDSRGVEFVDFPHFLIPETDGKSRYQTYALALMDGKRIAALYEAERPLTQYPFTPDAREMQIKAALGMEWNMQRLIKNPGLLPKGLSLSPAFNYKLMSYNPAPGLESVESPLENLIANIPETTEALQKLKQRLMEVYQFLAKTAASRPLDDPESVIIGLNNLSRLIDGLNLIFRVSAALTQAGTLADEDAVKSSEAAKVLELLETGPGDYLKQFLESDPETEMPPMLAAMPDFYRRMPPLFRAATGNDFQALEADWAGNYKNVPGLTREETLRRVPENPATSRTPEMLSAVLREIVRKKGVATPLLPEEADLDNGAFAVRLVNLLGHAEMPPVDPLEIDILRSLVQRLMFAAHRAGYGQKKAEADFRKAKDDLEFYVNYSNSLFRKQQLIPLMDASLARGHYHFNVRPRVLSLLQNMTRMATYSFEAGEEMISFARAAYNPDLSNEIRAGQVYTMDQYQRAGGQFPAGSKEPFLWALSPWDPSPLADIENPILGFFKVPVLDAHLPEEAASLEIEALVEEELKRQELRTSESLDRLVERAESLAGDPARGRLALLAAVNRPEITTRSAAEQQKALAIARAAIARMTNVAELLDLSVLMSRDLEVAVPLFSVLGAILEKMESFTADPAGRDDFRFLLSSNLNHARLLGAVTGQINEPLYDITDPKYSHLRETLIQMVLSGDPLEVLASFRFATRMWKEMLKSLEVPQLDWSLKAQTETWSLQAEAFVRNLAYRHFLEKGFSPEHHALALLMGSTLPKDRIGFMHEAALDAFRDRIKTGAFRAEDTPQAIQYLRFTGRIIADTEQEWQKLVSGDKPAEGTLIDQILAEPEIRAILETRKSELRAAISEIPAEQKLALYQSNWRTLLTRAKARPELASGIPSAAMRYAALFSALKETGAITPADLETALTDLAAISGLAREILLPAPVKPAAKAEKKSLLTLLQDQEARPVWQISRGEEFHLARRLDAFLGEKNTQRRSRLWAELESYIFEKNPVNRHFRNSELLQQRLMTGIYTPEAFGDAVDRLEALRRKIGELLARESEQKARAGTASLEDLYPSAKLLGMQRLSEAVRDPEATAGERFFYTRQADSIFFSPGEGAMNPQVLSGRLAGLVSKGLSPQSLAARYAMYGRKEVAPKPEIAARVRPLVAEAIGQHRMTAALKQALDSDTETRYAVLEELSLKLWPRSRIRGGDLGGRPEENLFEEAVASIVSLSEIARLARAVDAYSGKGLYFDAKPVLGRMDELLAAPQGQEEFESLIRSNNWIDTAIDGIFNLGVSQPLSDLPNYRKTLRRFAVSGDPELMMTSLNLIILYMVRIDSMQSQLARAGLGGQAAESLRHSRESALQTAREIFTDIVSHYGFHTEFYFTIFSDLYTQLLRVFPDFEDWVREAAVSVFREGLEQSDFSKVNFVRFENAMAAAAGASRHEMDRVLGAAPGTNAFRRLLTEAIPGGTGTWQQRYDEILKNEKARLEDPEIQQDLYTIVGNTIKTYEEITHRFPDAFEALLSLLNNPRFWAFHPDLAGHDLSDTGILIQQFYLQYQRHRYLHWHGESYRTLGQSVMRLLSFGGGLHPNFLLRVKDPGGQNTAFTLRADLAGRDRKSVRSLRLFPQGYIGDFPFLQNSRETYHAQLEAMLMNMARLTKEPERLADGLSLKDAEVVIAPLGSDQYESRLVEDLPEALSSRTQVMNFRKFVESYDEKRALEAWGLANPGHRQGLESVYKNLNASGLLSHAELGKVLAARVILYLRSDPARLETDGAAGLGTAGARMQVLARSLEVAMILRSYGMVFEDGLGRAVTEGGQGVLSRVSETIRHNLEILNRLYHEVVEPLTASGSAPDLKDLRKKLKYFEDLQRKTQSDMDAQIRDPAQIFYGYFPHSLQVYFDPRTEKYGDEKTRDFSFESQLDYHTAALQAGKSELRTSPVDEALKEVPYAVRIANENAGRKVFQLTERAKRQIESLTVEVLSAADEITRQQKAVTLNKYLSLGDAFSRRFWLEAVWYELPLRGDYTPEQIYQTARLLEKTASLTPGARPGVAGILQEVQAAEEIQETASDDVKKVLLGHMHLNAIADLTRPLVEAGNDFFEKLHNPKLEAYKQLMGDIHSIVSWSGTHPQGSQAQRSTIVELMISTPPSDRLRDLLAEIKEAANESSEKKVDILMTAFALRSKAGDDFQERMTEIMNVLSGTLENPEELLVFAGLRIMLGSTAAGIISFEPLGKRLNELLSDTTHREAFNNLLKNSAWIGVLWAAIWEEVPDTALDYPNIRSLFLENAASSDPVLVQRTLGLITMLIGHLHGTASAIPAVKSLQDQKMNRLTVQFQWFIATLALSQGLNLDRYVSVALALWETGNSWIPFRDALAGEFRKAVERGEAADFKGAERLMKLIVAGQGSSAEKAGEAARKALQLDDQGFSIFRRIAEGIPEEETILTEALRKSGGPDSLTRDSRAIVEKSLRDLGADRGVHSSFEEVLDLLKREPGRWNFHPEFSGQQLSPGNALPELLETSFNHLERQRLIQDSFTSLGQIVMILQEPDKNWVFNVDIQPEPGADPGSAHYRMAAMRLEPGIQRAAHFPAGFIPSWENAERHFADETLGTARLLGSLKMTDASASAYAVTALFLNPREESLKGWRFGEKLKRTNFVESFDVLNYFGKQIPQPMVRVLIPYLNEIYRVLHTQALTDGGEQMMKREDLQTLFEALELARLALYKDVRDVFVNGTGGKDTRVIVDELKQTFESTVLPAATGVNPGASSEDGYTLARNRVDALRPKVLGRLDAFYGGSQALDTYFDPVPGHYFPASGSPHKVQGLEHRGGLPTMEEYEETLRFYQQAGVKYWHLEAEEKEAITTLVLELLRAPDEAALEAADRRLGAYLNLRNALSRSNAAYAVLRTQAQRADFDFAAMQKAFHRVLARTPDPEKVNSVEELFDQVQNLVEGARDPLMDFQEQAILLIRANHAFGVLNNLQSRLGNQVQFFNFLRGLDPGIPLAWFGGRAFDESRIPKDPTGLFSQLGRFAESGDDAELRRYAASSPEARLRIVYEYNRYQTTQTTQAMPPPEKLLPVVIAEMQSVDEIFDYMHLVGHLQSQTLSRYVSLLVPRLEVLLADPQERLKVHRSLASLNWARRLWTGLFIQGIQDHVFDSSDPRYPNIRQTFIEGFLTRDAWVSLKSIETVLEIFGGIKNITDQAAQAGMSNDPAARQSVRYLASIEAFLIEMLTERFMKQGFESEDYHAELSALSASVPGRHAAIVHAAELALKAHLKAKREAPEGELARGNFEVMRIVRFFNEMAAVGDATLAQRNALLEAAGGDLNNTRFHRILRSELRPTSSELEHSLLEAAAYLIRQTPPGLKVRQRFLRAFEAARAPEIEAAIQRLASLVETEAFAGELLVRPLPAWRDPRVAAAMIRAHRSLVGLGLSLEAGEAADAVLITHNLPHAELILAILDAVPELNLMAVWMPREGFDSFESGRLESLQGEARLIEQEINETLGVKGREKRFQIRVPVSKAGAMRVLREAPRLLYTQGGVERKTGSLTDIRNRIVYIFPASSGAALREAAGQALSLEHSLDGADPQLFAKAFLLLKTAAEISEGVLSALLRSILDGENHYIFDDSRIPSEMLLALMAAQNEIEQHFAQAA